MYMRSNYGVNVPYSECMCGLIMGYKYQYSECMCGLIMEYKYHTLNVCVD